MSRFRYLFALIVSASVSVAGGRALAQEIVRKIEFEGVERISDELLKARLKTKEGAVLSQSDLDDDLKKLYSEGYFCKTVRSAPFRAGVRLTFVMEEPPIVKEILFQSEQRIREKELLAEIQLREKEPFSPHYLKADVETVRTLFTRRGYHFTKVSFDLKKERDLITVTFIVDRGKKALLKSIDFAGNTAFASKELQKQMQLGIDRWYNSKGYVEEMLKNDVERLRYFYYVRGWLDVEVASRPTRFSSELKHAHVTIDIGEGDQYSMRNLSYAGCTVLSEEEVRATAGLEQGQPYSDRDVARARAAIENAYGRQGYVDTKARHRSTYIPDEKQVDVHFQITEGEQFRVGRIDVKGNTRTKGIVVRRELTLLPGELLNTESIASSTRRIDNLGFFDEVSLDLEPGVDPDTKDVLATVKEGKTGMFRLGIGFSSSLNFLGNISLSQKNFDYADLPKGWDDLLKGEAFVGDGQEFDLILEPGSLLNRYRLQWREPWLYDRPTSFGASGYLFDRQFESYVDGRVGLGLSLGWREADFSHELGLRLEQVDIDDPDDDAPDDVLEAEGDHSVIGLKYSMAWDYRDRVFMSTEGYRLDASAELVGPLGDVDVLKIVLGASRFWPLHESEDGRKSILNLRAQIGWAWDYSSDDVPIFERFFAGGTKYLRGFEYRGVGPFERDDPIGGKFLLQGTAEYNLPLYEDTLRGVVFVDTGSVSENVSASAVSDIRVALGFGVRLRVPQLGRVPIRIDFGFPVKKESDDETELISFSLGTLF